ncbi:13361_t:CDS:2 [Funneliformis caledonium]|uniref:13361_t:CDS:1 n=1 Tax=Funneliformis caledonium TaxID=1117310 RepID=A0A9N9CXX6_9GLOM|nr:13361_t:CDS:2 [Funneliformis caledonium]
MATIFKLAKAQKNAADNNEKNGEVSTDKKSVKNKQRVLVLSSRGINYRQRHLLNDLEALFPHFKKDSKLDTKFNLRILNELAELNNCNNCVFFEVRKHQDLYMWTSKTPNGPSIKFHVQNIPKGARRSKPFIDHVISFTIVDNRIWFRNFQVVEKDLKSSDTKVNDKNISLVEIGPRFVLNVIRIFEGSFCGASIYANPEFITPNQKLCSIVMFAFDNLDSAKE